MSARDHELDNYRDALRRAIRLGETLQARIDSALELLEPHAEDPVVGAAIDRLEHGAPANGGSFGGSH